MGAVLSSLPSQVVVVVMVFVCKLVGFRQLSSIGISGDGHKGGRRCGGGDNNEVGKDDDSAALAAWCSCSCSAAMASLRSASGAVHADSHRARRQQRVRRTAAAAAANNSVQCARCLRAGNQCHPHIQRRLRCCCGCCPAPAAAAAARSCLCCTASSSQQRAAAATRVGQGDCTSADAGEHERDTAIAPRQKERNQLAWLSPTGNHHSKDSHCTCCNLNHKLHQHRSHQSKCTSVSSDQSRKFTFKNNNNKTLHQLQQQQARACNVILTTSGKTRHCKAELNFPHSSSETSAGESVGASDEEDADAESTSSQSSNTSIRTIYQARAPKSNNGKLNQLQVVLPLADHKFYLDDPAAKPLLQGKTTISPAKYSNKSRNSLSLLDLNLLELETTKTITKTTTTTTTKLKFTKTDTKNDQEQVRTILPTLSVRVGNDVNRDMAVLMSSQVPTAATTSVSRPQLPRQMAQTVSNRQLKRQANLRSENQHVEGPAMCTSDNNSKQKKQAQQKQKQLVGQQKSTNKSTSEKPITSRTFYSQSSSSSISSEQSTTKNRNIVKLSKQQRKLSAGGAPLTANVNTNRQVTGQQRRPPVSADSLADKNKLEQIAAMNKKHHQYKQQQYNKFTFDRNHIRSRENRSLSTCSSITTESNESSSGAAPPSSSSSANYSPASSGYSSPCSSGGAITTVSSHLSDKIKKFKPQPIEIKTYNSYQVNAGSPAQVSNANTPSSVASSVDSGTGGSLVDLTTVRQQQPLHPTVSALLMSTANLSLSRQVAMTPPPTPAKKSKKMQQQGYKNYMNLSRSPSSLASSSPAADKKPVQYTQDATYLARFEELAPPPMLAAPVAPPRPWLKPEDQLNYLSKSRLRQLKRSMDLGDHHLADSNSKRRSISTSLGDRDQQHLTTSNVRTAKTNHTIKWNQQQQQVSSSGEFTVLSYNVLSDRMVNKERFPSSPATALNWLYRRELILRQLLDYNADVIALQELEWEQYETYFKPKLESETGALSESKQVYCGVFEPKSRARTMDIQMRKRVDGCAIFYKRNKFRLVAHHLLEYNQIAMANARGCEAMLNRVMTKDNIGLAAVLELRNGGDHLSSDQHSSKESHASISSNQQQQPRRLIVCNTHIHWDPDCCDVKLVQTIMLMNELKHIARHYSDDLNNNNNSNYSAPAHSAGTIDQNNLLLLPLVLLGDFNSLPKSGVLEFLLQANIDSRHKDFKDIRYTQCSNALALRDSAQPRTAPNSPDGSSGLSTLLAPSLLRRSSQQPTGGAAADNTDSSRVLPAFEPELLSRRLSSPITNSTSTTKPLLKPSRSEGLDKPLQDDEMILQYEHPFRLASAYERGVMPFTNYTTHFKATIDYIFFDQTHVELTGLLGPLDKQWLKTNRIQGFPQLQFPSDHLPLLARFQLRDSVSRPAPTTASSVWPVTSAVLLNDCHIKAPVL